MVRFYIVRESGVNHQFICFNFMIKLACSFHLSDGTKKSFYFIILISEYTRTGQNTKFYVYKKDHPFFLG